MSATDPFVRAHPSPDLGIAQQLSDFARQAQSAPDMSSLLQRIVDSAAADIAGATHAGITIVTNGVFSTAAKSGDLVDAVDRLQNTLSEGPCVSSLRDEMTVRSGDLATDTRWPQFAAEAVRLGVRSVLCFQLFVGTDTLGALNLYGDRVDAFDGRAESEGRLLASHAAVAMVNADNEANLRTALHSRDIIGQAKGILMERYKFDEQHAIDTLISVSQRTQRKVHDIASHLWRTGELPGVTDR